MNDYYATLSIQQGRLKSAMIDMGIVSTAELARISGVSNSEIGKILNFKKSPKKRDGGWRRSVMAICVTLGYEPSELFPDYLDHEVSTNKKALLMMFYRL